MSGVTVFDIAGAFLNKSPDESLPVVKLQKLCFYAFGWYAHLTGEGLYQEPIYAMKYGPVTGELLSLTQKIHDQKDHAITYQQLSALCTIADLDVYVSMVIDYVWDRYGEMNDFDLVERSHDEATWKDAWESRKGKRGDMPVQAIVDSFYTRKAPEDCKQLLPSPHRMSLSQREWEILESAPSQPYMPFVEKMKRAVSRAK